MSKRVLTRRQSWRIDKIQQERARRAERQTDRLVTADNELGPEQPGRVVANFGAVLEVEGPDGGVRRCSLRQNLGLPVVGDRVVWQAGQGDTGVVVALLPRDSVLARPDFSGEMKPLAANLDRIVVVAAPVPAWDTHLVDQYLVAAEANGIAPAIVLNKADLLTSSNSAVLEAEFEVYRAVGYPVVMASTLENHGLEALHQILVGHTSVLVGQSGVGKSSLVRALVPEAEVRVGALQEGSGHGRHTTSSARLYRLPGGGGLIDSPGVREFRLWAMSRSELAQGFREFQPLLGHCRFRDCRHAGEPGCALERALAEGAISAARLESFRRTAAEIESRPRDYR